MVVLPTVILLLWDTKLVECVWLRLGDALDLLPVNLLFLLNKGVNLVHSIGLDDSQCEVVGCGLLYLTLTGLNSGLQQLK